MGNRWGNSGNSVRLYFLGAPKSLQMVTAAMKLKDAYSLEDSNDLMALQLAAWSTPNRSGVARLMMIQVSLPS